MGLTFASDLESILVHNGAVVDGDAYLIDLLELAVESPLPVAVVDEQKRLIGAIPRVTLLAALGNVSTQTGELDVIEPAPTIPVDVITDALRTSAPPAAEAAPERSMV